MHCLMHSEATTGNWFGNHLKNWSNEITSLLKNGTEFCSSLKLEGFFCWTDFWQVSPQCVFSSRGHRNTICHTFLAGAKHSRPKLGTCYIHCWGSKKYGGCQVFFHPDWILKGWENKAQSILVQSISRGSIRPAASSTTEGFFLASHSVHEKTGY